MADLLCLIVPLEYYLEYWCSMLSFLITFILIYSSMHVVFVLRVWPLFPQSVFLRRLLVLILLGLIFAPLLTHWLDHAGFHLPAKVLAWVSFTWMGVLFVAFCLGVVFYLGDGLVALFRKTFPGKIVTTFSPVFRSWLWVALTAALVAIGTWQAQQIRVQEIRVTSPKVRAWDQGLTLVQISDLHLGLLAGKKRVQAVFKLLEDIDPDILVCTGDLIDSNPEGQTELLHRLGKLPASVGKLAVTGNHEMYVGLDAARNYLRRAGFIVLDGRMWHRDGIALAGVGYSRNQDCNAERKVVEGFKAKDFNVLLKHSPRVCPDSSGAFDLQLSGHTHKGQIFPFSLLVKAIYPYLAGMYSLSRDSAIYVNPGTGTWGPQMRLLTRPEITVFSVQADQHPHARNRSRKRPPDRDGVLAVRPAHSQKHCLRSSTQTY